MNEVKEMLKSNELQALLKAIEIITEKSKTKEEIKEAIQEIRKELTDPDQGNR